MTVSTAHKAKGRELHRVKIPARSSSPPGWPVGNEYVAHHHAAAVTLSRAG